MAMEALRKRVVRYLREAADKIELGTCEMSEDEAMDILSVISHEVLSKEQACSYLNLRRSQFDNLVREGKLPRGRKRRGHKELNWYKDELDICHKSR